MSRSPPDKSGNYELLYRVWSLKFIIALVLHYSMLSGHSAIHRATTKSRYYHDIHIIISALFYADKKRKS
jgi:hypothetical protein